MCVLIESGLDPDIRRANDYCKTEKHAIPKNEAVLYLNLFIPC